MRIINPYLKYISLLPNRKISFRSSSFFISLATIKSSLLLALNSMYFSTLASESRELRLLVGTS